MRCRNLFPFDVGRLALTVQRSKRSSHLVHSLLLTVFFFLFSLDIKAADLTPGVPDPDIFRVIFSGNEVLHYEISWSGGIKIGDLALQIRNEEDGGYAIHARVTDYGVFKFFYPVDDVFVTFVRGDLKLPYRYEVLQREGRGSVTRRLTMYDQQGFHVKYQKNEEPAQEFDLKGQVHNEFSSFYATRAMELISERSFMVPTFADKKRNEVKVQVKGTEEVESILGRVRTTRVMPIMKFKGLYDKDGDTVIWFTSDECRVPVKINSKILIGSLTATLVSYSNSACQKH